MSIGRDMRFGDSRLMAPERVCCACGATMRETLRWRQDNTLFTLFECRQTGCPGRRLRREALTPPPVMAPLRPVTSAALDS